MFHVKRSAVASVLSCPRDGRPMISGGTVGPEGTVVPGEVRGVRHGVEEGHGGPLTGGQRSLGKGGRYTWTRNGAWFLARPFHVKRARAGVGSWCGPLRQAPQEVAPCST
jgi:hypothetical protein